MFKIFYINIYISTSILNNYSYNKLNKSQELEIHGAGLLPYYRHPFSSLLYFMSQVKRKTPCMFPVILSQPLYGKEGNKFHVCYENTDISQIIHLCRFKSELLLSCSKWVRSSGHSSISSNSSNTWKRQNENILPFPNFVTKQGIRNQNFPRSNLPSEEASSNNIWP